MTPRANCGRSINPVVQWRAAVAARLSIRSRAISEMRDSINPVTLCRVCAPWRAPWRGRKQPGRARSGWARSGWARSQSTRLRSVAVALVAQSERARSAKRWPSINPVALGPPVAKRWPSINPVALGPPVAALGPPVALGRAVAINPVALGRTRSTRLCSVGLNTLARRRARASTWHQAYLRGARVRTTR